jgi:hypothetical protein
VRRSLVAVYADALPIKKCRKRQHRLVGEEEKEGIARQ